MKITTMNRQAVKIIRDELETSLAMLTDQVGGVSFQVGRATYNPNDGTASFKIEVSVLGEKGEVVDKYGKVLDQLAIQLGLPSDARGKSFRSGREYYTLTGYNSRSPKFPFVGKRNSDNKSFKFTEQSVKYAFGSQPVIPNSTTLMSSEPDPVWMT